jgi:hypothetical protein
MFQQSIGWCVLISAYSVHDTVVCVPHEMTWESVSYVENRNQVLPRVQRRQCGFTGEVIHASWRQDFFLVLIVPLALAIQVRILVVMVWFNVMRSGSRSGQDTAIHVHFNVNSGSVLKQIVSVSLADAVRTTSTPPGATPATLPSAVFNAAIEHAGYRLFHQVGVVNGAVHNVLVVQLH